MATPYLIPAMDAETAHAAHELAGDCAFRGDEGGVLALFKLLCMGQDQPFEAMPFFNPRQDTVVFEMKFAYGRADIVVFHADGTATVFEAKDGKKGYTHVVAGIGQASLYAAQLSSLRAVKSVRRALLWSFIKAGDAKVIEDACEEAGVIPLPFWMPACRLLALAAWLPPEYFREDGEQAC